MKGKLKTIEKFLETRKLEGSTVIRAPKRK